MKKILNIILFITISGLWAQSIDIATLGKGQAIKLTGNMSSNFAYFDTDRTYEGMQPFTYFFQGNLNFSLYQFSMPVSYSYSNQGDNFNYRIPFNFNRLSLHPKYRWITAHIGDVSMNFSPYTLNGHQFTGGGLELAPKNGLKVGVMVGRLLKATEDDENARTIPAFKRMGYGAKLGYQKSKYQVAVSVFYAKDDIHSITSVPEEKKVLPKENLAISIESTIKILKDMQLKVEYASSALTQDLRSTSDINNKQGVSSLLFDSRASTEYFTAFKTAVNYKIAKTLVSFGYEHIDPGYQTLGAYYFNNDLENITLNASRPFFNSKMNLSFNIGYQKDNLDFKKFMSTNRMVGSVNLRLQAGKKWSFTGMYSNFSTYTNQKLNTLENLNNLENSNMDINRLNYKQLSQNANVTAHYILSQSKTRSQTLNLMYSLASTINEQGGIVGPGQQNNFHNVITAYNLGFPQQKFRVSVSANYILNDMDITRSEGLGGNLTLAKKFLEDKLTSAVSVGYNANDNNGIPVQLINTRLRLSLQLNKHQFSLNTINLFKNKEKKDNINELRINFAYNYSFDVINKNKKDKKFLQSPKKDKPIEKQLSSKKQFEKEAEHNRKELRVIYKDVLKVSKNLYSEALVSDDAIRKKYEDLAAKSNADKTNIGVQNEFKKMEKVYQTHLWILDRLEQIKSGKINYDSSLLKEFYKQYNVKINQIKQEQGQKKALAYTKLALLKFLTSKFKE